MAISKIESDSITTSAITTDKISSGAPLGMRNLIINGDMRIAQRGTSVTGITSAGYYTVDRWVNYISSLGTWTSTQDTDVPTGQGFANSLKMSCTTADASPSAGDVHLLIHRFEGQNLQHIKKGTSSAEDLTVSFWVKSNKTGTYIAELFDEDNVRQISKSYTISSSDTWEKKTLTFSGDTTGILDNNNGHSFSVHFWLGAGSDFTSGTLNTSWASNTNANRTVGQVNLADSTSNYINITGVQLEVGENATPFEKRMYGTELALCKRYYQIIRYMYFGAITGSTLSNWRAQITYSPQMRASPTVTYGTITSGFSIYNLLVTPEHLVFECGASARADFRPGVTTTTTISAEL